MSPLWSLRVGLPPLLVIAPCIAAFGRRGVWTIVPARTVIAAWRVADIAFANIVTGLRVEEIPGGVCQPSYGCTVTGPWSLDSVGSSGPVLPSPGGVAFLDPCGHRAGRGGRGWLTRLGADRLCSLRTAAGSIVS